MFVLQVGADGRLGVDAVAPVFEPAIEPAQHEHIQVDIGFRPEVAQSYDALPVCEVVPRSPDELLMLAPVGEHLQVVQPRSDRRAIQPTADVQYRKVDLADLLSIGALLDARVHSIVLKPVVEGWDMF